MNTALPLALALASGVTFAADPLAPRPNGMQPSHPSRVLIDNATVHVGPGDTLESADILIENGRIVRVAGTINHGQGQAAGAKVIDAQGHHVYAGFIDAYVPVDAPAPTAGAPGTHWSKLITPQVDSLAGEGLPEADAKKLRALGFTAAGIAPSSGIFRGTGAVVSTATPFDDPSLGHLPVYHANAAEHMGFETSHWSSGNYPTSHMGVVAMMRQSFIDAERRAGMDNTDSSCLDHIDPDALMIYDSSNPLEAMLSNKVALEFEHANVAIVGSGNEFKRLEAMDAADRAMIVPLVFPKAPDVFSVGEADATSLDDLMSWEHAPANARYLVARGLPVSITSSKLPKSQKFWANMDNAIDAGLSSEDALAALTTNPAKLLGVSDQLGTIAQGKVANLIIATDDLFDTDADATMLSLYIDGRHHHLADDEDTRFDGRWAVNIVGNNAVVAYMEIEGETIHSIQAQDPDQTKNKARKVNIEDDRISFLVDDAQFGTFLISGILGSDNIVRGTGVMPNQTTYEWAAAYEAPLAEADDDADESDNADAESDEETELTQAPVGAPFANYTVGEMPEQGIFLLTNATVWTQSDEGILEDAWVLVNNGKITGVGTGGFPRIAATVIDCEGKHITPGIIDAHSHTSLFRLGVNESGQAVTSEVRIADSIDPSHVNWYRQLAGGVTSALMLHGSANPIGGQSQTVKVRWGASKPEDMHFEGSTPGIKFALGENVKQSNWGDRNTTRYPQTRLGVETLMRDRFTKAAEYGIAWGILKDNARTGSFFSSERPSGSRSGDKPPRDLELETIAQIIAGERLIHCHSYRQDEILMLCRIAEDFGFKIGTFQHGLETYKVAEIVKEHAIGTSIFSDWWAFKVEVQDAIPYAGPINFEAGLMTSFNSDSDDLSRRMNVEAGKALRYALASGIDMSPQDALDFVTLNPAKQLRIDDRVGSIEPGKDADLAVWSGSPLSSMSRCERTFVDGRQLFSLDQDQQHRERMQAERARLVAKILEKGKPDAKDDDDEQEDSESEAAPTRRSLLARAYEQALNEHVEHGTQPGECGCNLLPRQLLQLNSGLND
ncbi:MAG: amidohydrolase family protein [Phycisphaerales bacterium]